MCKNTKNFFLRSLHFFITETERSLPSLHVRSQMSSLVKKTALGSIFAFFLSSFFLFLSIFFAFALRYLVLPSGTAIMREDLFFNFAEKTPTAMASFVEQPIYWEGGRTGENSSSSSSSLNKGQATTNIVKKSLKLLPWFSRKVQERIVSPHSTFDVHVQLDLPDSEYNRKVGMFQVKAELVNLNGETILDSMRPTLLRYQSPLVRWMKTLAYWPFHVAGFVEEKQTIDVRVFSKIRERRDFTRVAVKLLPRGQTKNGLLPEVYSASTTISLRMNVLQKALYFYPILSTVSVVGFNWFCLNTFAVIVTSLIMFMQSVSGKEEGTTMMDDVVHAIKSTTSATIRGSDKRQDKLIKSILASEDDTISITTLPGEMSSEPASDEMDIRERKDKMPASYRKDDELRRRK